MVDNKFGAFDYGSAKLNQKHYGQDTAPLYDTSTYKTSLADVPMLLNVGKQDALSQPKDVAFL